MNQYKKDNPFTKLPSYSPDDSVWMSIDNELSNIEKSKQPKQNKLPKYKAPDTIWNKVESTLEKKKRRQIRFSSLKLAAMLILLIGCGYVISTLVFTDKNNDIIKYTIENGVENSLESESNYLKGKTGFDQLLAENCMAMPDVCDSKEYNELKRQLVELEDEEKILRKQFATFKDAEIENYLLKISNEKLKVEKYMLNIFKSE